MRTNFFNSAFSSFYSSVLFVIWVLLTQQDVLSQDKSVIEILSESDHPMGRGTVVEISGELAYAITAYHVVFDNPALTASNFKIRDREGTIKKGAKVLKGQKDIDLALIQIPTTDALTSVEIGEIGQETDAAVYDIDWTLRRPRLSLTQQKFYYFDFSPVQGESGGPVFVDGKLVGVVSGGWFWIEKDVFETVNKRQTWPLRAPKIPRDFFEKNSLQNVRQPTPINQPVYIPNF
jgi:S1-C subfamily serine protease